MRRRREHQLVDFCYYEGFPSSELGTAQHVGRRERTFILSGSTELIQSKMNCLNLSCAVFKIIMDFQKVF